MEALIQHRGCFQLVSTGNDSDCRLLTMVTCNGVPFSYWMNVLDKQSLLNSAGLPTGFTSLHIQKRRGAVFLVDDNVLLRWRTERAYGALR